MTPKPDHRSPESGSAEDEIKLFFRWLGRRFVRLALNRYLGWRFVAFVAVALAAAGVFIFNYRIAHLIRGRRSIDVWLLIGCFLCVALLFAMVRHHLRGKSTEWPALDFAGRVGRVTLVIAGTALFLAPFAWVAWLMLVR